MNQPRSQIHDLHASLRGLLRGNKMISSLAGADAGLLRISQPGSAAGLLQKVTKAVSDIPWGVWLEDSNQGEVEKVLKDNCDFMVFAATGTPLTLLKNEEVGKILEVEASINEGLLRAANELPIDAVLVTGEKTDDYFLTWQHLLVFQRFADLLNIPLLVSVPLEITADEFQALWEAVIDGVVVAAGQLQGRLQELRQIIDKLTFPLPRRHDKIEPRLPGKS